MILEILYRLFLSFFFLSNEAILRNEGNILIIILEIQINLTYKICIILEILYRLFLSFFFLSNEAILRNEGTILIMKG